MFRLIHNQTIQNGILVDDIDDGLPNKEVHRLGSTADPKAYVRDGYANKVKQPCYIPYSMGNAGFPTIPGYIDLNQSNRVTLSAGKGKIFKLSKPVAAGGPGLVTVVDLVASQIVAPVVTAATSASTNFVITGTTFTSVSPDITTVTFAQGTAATAPSPAVWTQSAITTAGGTVSGTSISIPFSAFTTEPVTNNTVVVQANEKNSNTFAATSVTDEAPVITGAHTVSSNFVITGTDFGPTLTLVTFATGTGGTTPSPLTLSASTITTAGGSITGTTVTIPTSAFTTAPVAGNTVKVHANGQDSNVFSST